MSPMKNREPNFFLNANFGHPVYKSWLRPCEMAKNECNTVKKRNNNESGGWIEMYNKVLVTE